MIKSKVLLLIAFMTLSLFALNACTVHYVDDNGYHKGHYKVKKNKNYYDDDDDDDDDDYRRGRRVHKIELDDLEIDDLDFDIDPELKIKISG